MKLVDIHSHILPGIDDGAKDVETSIKLLEVMKEQGITDVVATPHFYAMNDNLEQYSENVKTAEKKLRGAVAGRDLPNVLIGSEVFYFQGIGKSKSIEKLTIADSSYILLEFPICRITNSIVSDIEEVSYEQGLTPILAHIERYSNQIGFKKILRLINSGTCYAQVNAASLINSKHKKTVVKLIKKGYISFIATDSHSTDKRPPLMDKALNEVENIFGKSYREAFIRNSEIFYHEIIGDNNDDFQS